MTFKDVLCIYEKKKKDFGNETYKYVSQIFGEIKNLHRQDALRRGIKDTEQSWRSFKGKTLEKLIQYIIEDEVKNLGLGVVNGNKLDREINNDEVLAMVKRNLLVDFGKFGSHLPDADIVIYNPKTCKVIAIISSKVTLRERIAETGYWKLKLNNSKVTQHIKVFFATLDEDDVFQQNFPTRKARAICEVDTDGCYVLTNKTIASSKNVKLFSNFIDDLKNLKF